MISTWMNSQLGGSSPPVEAGLKLVPDTADSFYIVHRGTLNAYHFIKGSGGSGGNDAGNKWPEWRLSGISRLGGYDDDPSSPSHGWSNDPGAQDIVGQSSANRFLGSYHGLGASGSMTSQTVKIDGVDVDPTVGGEGEEFILTNATTATDGTGTFTRELETKIGPDAQVKFRVISASGTSLSQIYCGMAIANDDQDGSYDETHLKLSSSGSYLPLNTGMGDGRLWSPDTYAIRLRSSGSGRTVTMAGVMPTVGSFSRGESVRQPSGSRLKGYFRFTAATSLAGTQWALEVDDTGTPGASSFGTNLITNGNFATDLTGWTTVQGPAAAWQTPGYLRMTRDTTVEGRIRPTTGLSLAAGTYYAYQTDVVNFAGTLAPIQRVASATSMTNTGSILSQSAVQGRNIQIVKPSSSATYYPGIIFNAGTNTQTTDLDNMSLINLGTG